MAPTVGIAPNYLWVTYGRAGTQRSNDELSGNMAAPEGISPPLWQAIMPAASIFWATELQ